MIAESGNIFHVLRLYSISRQDRELHMYIVHVFMSTPFKGGRHIVLLRLESASASALIQLN